MSERAGQRRLDAEQPVDGSPKGNQAKARFAGQVVLVVRLFPVGLHIRFRSILGRIGAGDTKA